MECQLILDHIFSPDFQSSYIYQRLCGLGEIDKSERNSLTLGKVLTIFSIVVIVFVKVQIERFEQRKKSEKNIVGSVCICLAYAAIVHFSSDKNETFLALTTSIYSWFLAGIPMLFIATYENLKNFVEKKLNIFLED